MANAKPHARRDSHRDGRRRDCAGRGRCCVAGTICVQSVSPAQHGGLSSNSSPSYASVSSSMATSLLSALRSGASILTGNAPLSTQATVSRRSPSWSSIRTSLRGGGAAPCRIACAHFSKASSRVMPRAIVTGSNFGGPERRKSHHQVDDALIDVLLRHGRGVAAHEKRLLRFVALQRPLPKQAEQEIRNARADAQRRAVRLEGGPLQAARDAVLDEQLE